MESNEKQERLDRYKKILYDQKISKIKLIRYKAKIRGSLMSTTWLTKI